MSNPAVEFLVPAIAGVLRWGPILLLGFATLIFGGTPSWAGAVIILSAFGLAALWLIQGVCAGQFEFRPTPVDLPILLFLGLILLQLFIGYPIRLNQPDLGQGLLTAARANPGGLTSIPGTLDYHATRSSLLFFLAYVACFYLVVHTVEKREQVIQVLLFIVGVAGAAGIYGLLEYLSGNQGVLGLKPAGGGRVRGTFINPDHFGAFLTMALMAGIGGLIALGTRRVRRRNNRGGARHHDGEEGKKLAVSASRSGDRQERLSQNVLLLFVLGLVGTTLVFTMSRGAIVSALVAGGVVAGMLGLHESLGRRRLLAAAVLLLAGAFVLWIGLGPVLDRFGGALVGWSERLIIYKQGWGIVRDFPILGTGFATFGSIFSRYQTPPLNSDIQFSYAHSDLLQLLTDGGVLALGIFGLGFWAYIREVAAVRILGIARPASLWVWRSSGAISTAAAILLGVAEWYSHGSLGAWPALAAGLGTVALLAIATTPGGTPGDGEVRVGPPTPPQINETERSARRRDPFNVGIALGGLGALTAILVHSIGDFSLRIPANALLLTILLAVTLQTARVRFRSFGHEFLSPVVIVPLRSRFAVIVVAGALAMFGWLSWMTVAAAVAESKIAKATEMREGAGQVEPANSGRPWVTWTRQTAKALSLLEAAVRLDPTNARGHLEIGRAYEGLALRAWNAGVSAEGRLLSETAQRAEESRLLMGKALAAFARAAYLAPMEREVWGEIGWAHGILARTLPDEQAGSDREASLLAFRRGMALRPNDPYPFQLQAEFAFQWAQGQRGRLSAEQILASEIYQAGIRATQQLIELQPGFLPEALNRVLLFTRDFAVIQRVIPTHAPDFLFAARLLEDQGFSGVSRLALERAVTLAGDEDRPIFYQYLAEDSIKRGELSDAIRLLEFIHGLDPQNPDIRIMLGNAFARQKVYDRAEMEYEAAVEMARRLAPSRPFRTVAGGSPSEPLPPTRLEMVESALRERGLLPVDQGRDPLAKALAALAAFHEMSEQPRLAIPLWEQAIARAPRDSEIHFGYGESLDSVGAWIAAQGEYRKALELDPANVGLRLRLASKYEEHGLVEQAIAMWQEIARIRPGNVQAHVSLAGAYENLGRRKDAEVEYDQILRLDPGNEVAREALTRLRRGVVRERRSLSSASRAPETKSGESLPSEPESDSN